MGSGTRNLACAACKERKIYCDRKSPICGNCTESNRSCRRYIVRLSWPRTDDRRRAIVAHPKRSFLPKATSTRLEFIHTSWRDVELHNYVSEYSCVPRQLRGYVDAYVLAPNLSGHGKTFNYEMELVPFFLFSVLPSLPMFAIDQKILRSTIVRLAFQDDSVSSHAVLSSLLAWATFSKYGHSKQVNKHVTAALSLLRASMKNGIGHQGALQHILAGVLVCLLEVLSFLQVGGEKPNLLTSITTTKMHLFSQTSPVWLLYLSGTKKVIHQFYGDYASEDTDQKGLFQWVLYLDTLAKLGMRHWHGCQSLEAQLSIGLGLERGGPQFAFHPVKFNEPIVVSSTDMHYSKPNIRTNRILDLFSDFCYNVLSPDDPRYFSVEYISWLGDIENQLVSVREQLQQQRTSASAEPNGDSETFAVKELFVLAILVYITKKSTQLVGLSSKTNEWIESAFRILSELETCNKPFPLFIFGLEARTDDRRLLILGVIDSTIKEFSTWSLGSVKRLLLKSWVQYDLHAGDGTLQEREMCSFLGLSYFGPCLI